MTGLDPDVDVILSVACFVTDHGLNLADEQGYMAVIKQESSTLNSMGEWCRKQHGESGLTAACASSPTTAEDAADGLLKYVRQFVKEQRTGLLAGNSIHADAAFLRKSPFKSTLNHLHYRMLDVSSIKEGARRWAPEGILREAPAKKGLHDARADILESIEEARFYKAAFFEAHS